MQPETRTDSGWRSVSHSRRRVALRSKSAGQQERCTCSGQHACGHQHDIDEQADQVPHDVQLPCLLQGRDVALNRWCCKSAEHAALSQAPVEAPAIASEPQSPAAGPGEGFCGTARPHKALRGLGAALCTASTRAMSELQPATRAAQTTYQGLSPLAGCNVSLRSRYLGSWHCRARQTQHCSARPVQLSPVGRTPPSARRQHRQYFRWALHTPRATSSWRRYSRKAPLAATSCAAVSGVHSWRGSNPTDMSA